ncbi:transcriptional regulator DagR [Serratia fonticola]|uniref:transcriptional regulator DagR n=1 Tax=Serratia fonticola TaxID=47917 RepID=UPI002182B30D|nr:sigma-54-dependent transcriptional regulator [Serratia fonticola]CAI2410086.1 Regulatory protein luxO [Serratia fonticola]
MKRKDAVRQELERLTLTLSRETLEQSAGGFAAETIAFNLGLARNSVSKDLNELHCERLVIKIKSRPVLFLHRAVCEQLIEQSLPDDRLEAKDLLDLLPAKSLPQPASDDPFHTVIGYDRSLRLSVEKGKAAVLYPGGLHVLLTGPSGVGKTFFAEVMHQFATVQQPQRQIPLVYFNCAEYAHNPELLSSHLFGHKQGAFTGAIESKRGLIEQADGGFLLLDEVHRLPYEGQEKLFSILDKGEYRPLGSSDKARPISVRLICATTESPDSTLLRTFLRRIQVSIAIPALRERSLEEQVEIITGFLQLESRKIGRIIRLDKGLLLYLLEKPLSGNIGQLKSDIQFLCAQAWASGMGHSSPRLLLDKRLMDVPHSASASSRLLVDALFGQQEYLDISSQPLEQLKQHLSALSSEQDSDLFYTYLTREYVNLRNSNVPPQETLSILKNKLRTIFEYGLYSRNGGESEERYYGGQVEQRITLLIGCIEQVLGFPLPQNMAGHLRKHLLALLSYVQKGLIPNLYSSSLILDYCKDEYDNANQLCRKINEIFHIQCPSTEIVYLCLFLKECRSFRQRKEVNPDCGAMLIGHGTTTASSMAHYVNRVLECELFTAIDMPFEQSVHDTLELLIATLREKRYQRLILIVDIGSLVHFASTVSKLFHIDVLLIQNITMGALLEIGLDLTYETSDFAPLMQLMASKGIAHQLYDQREDETGKVLAISCITGMGTAVKIKKVLEESFGELMAEDTRMVLVDYNEARSLERLRQAIGGNERLVGIVGTFQPGLPDIPFIALEELFSEQGPELVLSLLNPDLGSAERQLQVERCSMRFISALTLESIINHISVLNPQRILQEIEAVLHQICRTLDLQPSRQVTLRFLIHCCCMVERIVLSHKPLQIALDAQQDIDQQAFSVIKDAFSPIERAYSIRLSDAEYFYIYELLYR